MEVKIEGRQVDIGDELRERINKLFDNLDQRFGPLTHARISVERKAHNNEQRASAKTVVNVAGKTLSAAKESATVVGAVNDTMETLTQELLTHLEKSKKNHR
ncbi:MAG: ribosome-associated translation inhibitor RaiA [Magnetococcales bacterium]|nr:ribosome-associated translation inhibitor RaiA [Magnetococcales bacterium]